MVLLRIADAGTDGVVKNVADEGNTAGLRGTVLLKKSKVVWGASEAWIGNFGFGADRQWS